MKGLALPDIATSEGSIITGVAKNRKKLEQARKPMGVHGSLFKDTGDILDLAKDLPYTMLRQLSSSKKKN